MSLFRVFLDQVEARPEAPGLITRSGRVISFGALAGRARARAVDLQRAGVGPGDRVLIARGVSSALYETLLGVFARGAVAVFPEPAAGVAGVRHAVRAAAPKAYAAGMLAPVLHALVPEVRTLVLAGRLGRTTHGAHVGPDAEAGEVNETDPALITFTSGSTGVPKGVLRTAGFLLLQHQLIETVRRTTPQDVDLISLPVFILSNLAAGAASVIPDGPMTRPARMNARRLLAQVHRHGVSRIMAPPAVCEALTRLDDGALDRVEAVFTGGGPVFPNLLRGLERVAPNARIIAAYGSTEAEPIAHVATTAITPDDWARMAAGEGLLAGAPIDEIRVELVDDEIWVAGPHVNTGYLNRDDDAQTKVLRDGVIWHRTGDAARLDDQGRLWLLGRVGAAANGLYPFAVETAARSWPGVTGAALLAQDDRSVLAVSGASVDLAGLERAMSALGPVTVVKTSAIPMDQRHNSKVDYARLRHMIARRMG